MKVLIAKISPSIYSHLKVTLLDSAFDATFANSNDEAFQAIEKNRFTVIVMDFEAMGLPAVQKLINKIYDDTPDHLYQTRFLVISRSQKVDFVTELMRLGVDGFVSKKNDDDDMIKKLIEKLDYIAELLHEKRRHIRVDIGHSDKGIMEIPLPGVDKSLKTRINNVSMGGVSIKVQDRDYLTFFNRDAQFHGLQLELQKWRIVTDGKVAGVVDNNIGIQFVEMKDGFKAKLAQFIFTKVAGHTVDQH